MTAKWDELVAYSWATNKLHILIHMGTETHRTLSTETKVFWDARPAV